MKRLRVILGFLLAGVFVNVAVSWGFALTPTIKDPYDVTISMFYTADENWRLIRTGGFGTQFYASTHEKVHRDEKGFLEFKEFWDDHPIENVKPTWGSMGVTTNLYRSLPGPPATAREFSMFDARGWPMRSLWCLRYLDVYDGTSTKQFRPRGLIATPILPDDDWGPRGLPLYPIWHGFVVNMLFYAAFLWLLFTSQRSMRRFIRRKHGLCVTCGYDLRGADHKACPECGAALVRTNIA